jgi:hypothetical protein
MCKTGSSFLELSVPAAGFVTRDGYRVFITKEMFYCELRRRCSSPDAPLLLGTWKRLDVTRPIMLKLKRHTAD